MTNQLARAVNAIRCFCVLLYTHKKYHVTEADFIITHTFLKTQCHVQFFSLHGSNRWSIISANCSQKKEKKSHRDYWNGSEVLDISIYHTSE